MDRKIKEWLKQISTLKDIPNADYSQQIDTKSFFHSNRPNNIEIGEIDFQDIDRIELDSNKILRAGVDEINESTELNGYGSLTLKSGDYFKGDFFGCISEREGEFIRLSKDGSTIEGSWRNGKPDGCIEMTGTLSWKQIHYQNGQRNGLFREFLGYKPTKNGNHKSLLQVGFYEKDRPIGIVWRQLVGGSFLVGELDDESGEFTGKDILYLYPDLLSGIKGRFVESKLISGYTCFVNDLQIDTKTGILIPIALKNENSDNHDTKIKRDVSTHKRISNSPLIPDKWEQSRVEVRKSLVETSDGIDAGEGLFAKCKIKEGEIVALFNGVRQQSEKNSYSVYRIRLNGEIDLDIPDECVNIENYCATQGHKTNHSFSKPNSRWARLDHPRFGLICAIASIRDIEENEEILVNYGLPMADAPSWYKQLWVDHVRKNEGWSDEKILKWCNRKYVMNGKRIQLPL